jgi:hypothetical protein
MVEEMGVEGVMEMRATMAIFGGNEILWDDLSEKSYFLVLLVTINWFLSPSYKGTYTSWLCDHVLKRLSSGLVIIRCETPTTTLRDLIVARLKDF